MKLRLLICGQKPKRIDALEREFGSRAKLAFHYDGNLHQLQDVASHADHVFVTTAGVGHKDSNALRKAVREKNRITYVGGGGTSLRESIAAYLEHQPKGEA